ncbi:MAG: hypothetical protein GY862_08845 [Gammaproteobacteria bacterium]|nr:hypothetical protein [Gammaproteobacteria bacterium]
MANIYPYIILCLLLVPPRASGDYLYGDPTPAEQAHLEAINRARADPQAEALRLGLSDLAEGTQAGAVTGLPAPPLALNAQVSQAARAHSQDMMDKDYFDHTSLDGTRPSERVSNAGYEWRMMGENLASRWDNSSLDIVKNSLLMHDDLFVDTDYPDRAHRVSILLADFKEIGIGLVTGQRIDNGSTFNFYYITTDFVISLSDSRSFVLGAAYSDKDADGVYDAGEGLEGIQVTVAETGENTATASAGGYAMPLNSGNYTLVFSHPALGEITRGISVSSDNIKVDILETDFGAASPQASFDVNTNRLHLPAVQAGTDFYTLTMTLENTPDLLPTFSLASEDLRQSANPNLTEMPNYDAGTAILHIPRIAVENFLYTVNLRLINSTAPFRFQLIGTPAPAQ